MKVLVCVKQVKGELNPFDASSLECALRIPGAQVILLSMGRPEVAEMLRGLTRLGVAHAILLSDPTFAGSDTLATAYVLSLAAGQINPDLIVCGRQSVDGDTAQVGPSLAAMLGIPVITNVMELRGADKQAECQTRLGAEAVPLPALITVERGYTLRFPRIRAKTGEVEIWDAQALSADPAKCGLRGSPTRVLRTYESTLGKRKCKFIMPQELPKILDQALNSPRHSVTLPVSKIKLPEVWSIGAESLEMARTIADSVRIIERQPPAQIAELARKESPQVILWDSGLWGRRNAPQVAALLQTGLCADCTTLETDGEQLFMYRPAYGGNIMAKIVCRTLPQMATVRTVEESAAQVVLAAGAGAHDDLPRLREWAQKRGYTLAASRALVDQGLMPYECQVGLTGRSVNPAVYIACGISGAVQHTCAIEQAGTVVAINRDKNARIFEYADYGIVSECSAVFHQARLLANC
ncbi:MAG TPA: hypothetical protein GX717_03645 [Clostridiaceae bacterium]|nr:hypothetical protein [Clostridiaceae bacterium]